MVSHSSKEKMRSNREPAAYGSFCQPRRGEERGVGREKLSSATLSSADLCQPHDENRSKCKQPRIPMPEYQSGRKQAQLSEQPRWTGEFVIGLANALRPEMGRGRGKTPDEGTVQNLFGSTGGEDRPDELEILEHHRTVVASGRPQRRFANSECAGPISTEYAIQKCATGVPPRVPWQRSEEILRPHHVEIVQRLRYRNERRQTVSNVIIGNNDSLMGGEPNSGQHTADFSHWCAKIRVRGYMANEVAPSRLVTIEYCRRRAVDDDHFRMFAEPYQVPAKLPRAIRDGSADGQDVRNRGIDRLWHACQNGQHVCRAIT